MKANVLRIFSISLVSAALCACGIDRGGIDTPQTTLNPNPTVANVNGAAIAGKISSVNNSNNMIIINGISLNTSAATITVNGESASIMALLPGMVAVATTTPGGDLAMPNRVQVDYNVAGGVIEANAMPNTINQLGQTLFVGDLILPLTVADLVMSGDAAAFSGFTTSAGVVDASAYVVYPDTLPRFVTGIAQNVDTTTFNFTIGAQSISYAQAVTINTATGMVDENARVRVQLAPGGNTGTWQAVSVTDVPFIANDLGVGATSSVAGYVFSVGPQDQFTVSNVPVNINADTVFSGVTYNTLNLDTQVLVTGVLTQDRKILADSVAVIN